ncbi:hypothetical protein ESY86_19785 [Subsaximicrobium wynnwilliamsii]|uniref:Uncharacterized protein n=1 Tax=Subsaximicrobium wynnwilliamsii TaxID=291179 RepID=A0A5C6ZD21_9FLAO|nr:hypothetical protein [Subsaximicrobium wynnwilliamsii]TXD80893.1 hypothetical protein ESY87_19925 [Subsaximicrobium wynnwilliamsii]TXD86593.1 hypothetical protein ESY86_19785 [Subsaximicrobium wynnwilliamsii]TXE00191.1 hypothetical protein ESY88_19875 [Subsaximicrobium wynnwilliamsii]
MIIGTLDLLNYLFDLSKYELSNNENFKKLTFTTKLMINQEIKSVDEEIYKTDTLNFKHNGVFLTLGDRAAITHSHYNKYGSEILNRIMQIQDLLIENNIETNIPEKINPLKIEELVNYEPKPIFIKIKRIDYRYLLNKRDIPMFEAMEKIEEQLKTTSENVSFSFKQTTVFKYIKPIEKKDLVVYELEYDGHPIDENFEYYLTEIK